MAQLLGIVSMVVLVPMLAFNLLGILLLPAAFLVVAAVCAVSSPSKKTR